MTKQQLLWKLEKAYVDHIGTGNAKMATKLGHVIDALLIDDSVRAIRICRDEILLTGVLAEIEAAYLPPIDKATKAA